MNLSGSFSLIGLMDGTTLNCNLRVEGSPLIQRYSSDSSTFVPNFDTMSDNDLPLVVLVIRDATTGSVLKGTNLSWKYNDQILTFGADNLSTNASMVGLFETVPNYAVTVDGKSYELPALRIKKNLVPISGYDNDMISVEGFVEIQGQSLVFNTLYKEVVIQEASTNQVDVLIVSTSDYSIDSEDDTVVLKPKVFKGGNALASLSDYTIKWYKVSGSGETLFAETESVTIGAADVDSTLILRCDILLNDEIIGSGYTEITDISDTYYITFTYDGIKGSVVLRGQTATVTPKVYSRKTNNYASGFSMWDWYITNNLGQDFTIHGKTAARFTAASAEISFEDLVAANYGLNGYISLNQG